MSQLRELTLGNNKCLFPWPPEAHGHQASAVRTDIPGNRPFLRTRGHRHCELDQDNQGRTPFDSSVEVPLAKTKWWSTRIHGWLKSLPDSKPLPLETFLASPTKPLTFGYRGGNCGETSIPWQVIPLVRPGKASSWGAEAHAMRFPRRRCGESPRNHVSAAQRLHRRVIGEGLRRYCREQEQALLHPHANPRLASANGRHS
jgi:hypothetical protein